MSDNELYAVIWRSVAATIVAIAASIAGCTAHQNYVQTEVMVKSANPSAVQCAFGNSTEQSTPFCLEIAKH
jgi:hypothetical protein